MKNLFIIAVTCLSCLACEKTLLGPVEENTLINTFEYFWQDFNDHYANFRVKGIDWQAQYDLYRPQLNENSTEEDLYQVLVNMMDVLDDAHVSLYPGREDLPFYASGPAFRVAQSGIDDFELDIVRTYLEEEIQALAEDNLVYGLLPDNIGYLYIGAMFENLDSWEDFMDTVMKDLRDTKGLILDLRDNGGGEDEAGRLIASYFTDKENPYMKVRYKNGKGANDFEETRFWSIAPAKSEPYTKPLIMLTDRYTVSAGETFGLALKTLPQMIQVGDTTSAAFSDTIDRELPNRWHYTISVAEVTDQDDVSWEGIGLLPDIVIRNTNKILLVVKI